MIEQLISKVFAARNAAHLEHWSTGSYSKHKALGEFYVKVIDRLDDLVEAYSGAFGKIEKIALDQGSSPDCYALLGEQAVWISHHKDQICREIDALENIVDEIVSLYLTTLYKLKELS